MPWAFGNGSKSSKADMTANFVNANMAVTILAGTIRI